MIVFSVPLPMVAGRSSRMQIQSVCPLPVMSASNATRMRLVVSFFSPFSLYFMFFFILTPNARDLFDTSSLIHCRSLSPLIILWAYSKWFPFRCFAFSCHGSVLLQPPKTARLIDSATVSASERFALWKRRGFVYDVPYRIDVLYVCK